ncbi:MAG: Rid family hydrolase [Bryobacterales bacterium]
MIDRITAAGGAPAQGPYSHAVKAGGFIYVSGQAALDPKTGTLLHGTIEEETRQTIENIKAILEAASASLADVIKCSVFLTDIRRLLQDERGLQRLLRRRQAGPDHRAGNAAGPRPEGRDRLRRL